MLSRPVAAKLRQQCGQCLVGRLKLFGAELGQQDLRGGVKRCQGVGASLCIAQQLPKSVFRCLLVHTC
jgi:hypothetical protein